MDIELDFRRRALAGLRKCLAGYVDRTSRVAGRRGCLGVATAMELAAHDAEVEQRIRRLFKVMETRLGEALARAKREGDLADGVAPPIAARLLLCQLEGMRVMGKTGPDRATSHAMVQIFIDRLVK